MSKSSTITIACALCVGATPERYLPATLASIAGAVDALVVNYNSRDGGALAYAANGPAVAASTFGIVGGDALREIHSTFVDFADMRNRAFAALASLPVAPDWVLFLDADEVHGEQLRYVTREILPSLAATVSTVDGYTFHFWGTFDWVSDIARRMMLYRYAPELRWENAVHEKIVGLSGSSLVLPYVYHHYGNVAPPAMLARKHGQYFELGNAVPEPVSEAAATLDVYLEKKRTVRPYELPHPVAARPTLYPLRSEWRAWQASLNAAFAAERAYPQVVASTFLSELIETGRVEARRLQHPLLFPFGSRAR